MKNVLAIILCVGCIFGSIGCDRARVMLPPELENCKTDETELQYAGQVLLVTNNFIDVKLSHIPKVRIFEIKQNDELELLSYTPFFGEGSLVFINGILRCGKYQEYEGFYFDYADVSRQ